MHLIKYAQNEKKTKEKSADFHFSRLRVKPKNYLPYFNFSTANCSESEIKIESVFLKKSTII
jgi:hypothetical protein